jgi:hypothetical protein
MKIYRVNSKEIKMLLSKIRRYFDLRNLAIIISIYVCFNSFNELKKLKEDTDYLNSELSSKTSANQSTDIVFFGGFMKNGLSMMKNILDMHPLISCNQETNILQHILLFTIKHYNSTGEMARLKDAGIGKNMIQAATGAFLLELFKVHKKSAQTICTLLSFSLLESDLLTSFIPNSKYVLLLEDKTIYDQFKNSENSMIRAPVKKSYLKCLKLGRMNCFIVYYDMLILEPEAETKKLFNFLNVPWIEDFLKIIESFIIEARIEMKKS